MSDDVEVLEFGLGDERCCVEISEVAEVVEQEEDLTAIPNAPDHVEGVMDLRGATTTIIDPRQLYGLDSQRSDPEDRTDEPSDGRIIVFDEETVDMEGVVGWSVDRVFQVSRVSSDDVDTTTTDGDATKGVVNTGDGFMIWTTPESSGC